MIFQLRYILPALLMLMFQSTSALSQSIELKVIDEDNKPIPYVNIGIPGTTFGTVSDEFGNFKLQLNASVMVDTLLISSLGYEQAFFPINNLVERSDPIQLTPTAYTLEEITVRAGKRKKKKYGQLKGNKNVARATVFEKGNEDVVLIKSDRYPYRILNTAVQVSFTKQKEYSFRVRFYAVDEETGAPGKELTEKNYILTSKKKKGFVKLDMRDEQLWFDQPVYLSFEWLITKEYEERVFTYIDSVKTLSKQMEEETDPDKKLEITQKVVEVSNAIPTTYFVVAKKPRNVSYSRESFIGKWKKLDDSIVAYLEVEH